MKICAIIEWEFKRHEELGLNKVYSMREFPSWMTTRDGDSLYLKLVKVPKRERKRLNREIDAFGKRYGIRIPLDFRRYVLSFWKHQIPFIEDDYIEYNFYATMPNAELDEFIRDIEYFREYGGEHRYIPIGFDDCGELVLLNTEDDTVWLLDTDRDEYRQLDNTLTSFLDWIKSPENPVDYVMEEYDYTKYL